MTQSTIYVIDAFLFLFAVMVARSREVRWYQVFLISMAGFLLAMTPMGYPVWWTFLFIGNGLFG
ncbi:hypothetical protein ACFQ0X_12385 [Streptomyces rectiviolaceus]|uniref:Uncharacterized protein n=1 Tax=Streptomyces rectiviolaceus TaxID=332591 RepID=A0ABP6MXD2_9ACTN